jgi:hypothetical protein
MAGTGTMSLRYADRMHQDGSACVDLVDGLFALSVSIGVVLVCPALGVLVKELPSNCLWQPGGESQRPARLSWRFYSSTARASILARMSSRNCV